ncbi:MAG: EamA family transporter [Planctomycetota bacterium]
MPYLSFATVCLLFGSNFYLMALSLTAYGPVAVGAGRVVGAAVVMFVLWWLVTPTARVPRNKVLSCLGFGFLANGYPYVVQPYLIGQAIEIGEGGGHSFFGMMVAFTPLLTIMVSPLMIGVWPTTRQLVGVVIGLGFMGLLLQDGSHRGITPVMLLMAISVPMSYAVANTYLRRTLSDVPSIPLSATMLLAPSVLLTLLALCEPVLVPLNIGAPEEPKSPAVATAALLILGALGTGLTMWLFVRLVQAEGPLFAGMVTYVVPVIALLWGAFDGEMITTRQLVGIAGVLSMVALVQFGPQAAEKQPPDSQPADSAKATGEV